MSLVFSTPRFILLFESDGRFSSSSSSRLAFIVSLKYSLLANSPLLLHSISLSRCNKLYSPVNSDRMLRICHLLNINSKS